MVEISIANLLTGCSILVSLLIVGPVSWIVNNQTKRIEKLEDELDKIQMEWPHKYVLRDELVRQIDRLEKAVNLVFDRLNNKADK